MMTNRLSKSNPVQCTGCGANISKAPVAVEGSVGVVQGRTRYFRPDSSVDREFDNIFVLHFDEAGRCERFTEWYMRPRSAQQAAT